MNKIKTYIPGILVVLLAFGSVLSPAKSQKRSKSPSKLRKEVPDLLERDVLPLRKLPPRADSVAFKPLEYGYQPIQLKQDTLKNKGINATAEKSESSFFEYHLGCGSFKQFDVDFATWQKFNKTELKLDAYYHRNEGQFENSRLNTGIFSGNISHRINPRFRVNSNLAYHFRNYLLQAAPQSNTERKRQNYRFTGNLPIQTSANSLALFQIKLSRFDLTEQAPKSKSPFENRENTLSLAGKYFYRLNNSVLLLDVNFFYNSFSAIRDSSTSDLISNVKTQFIHRFNSKFSVVAGVTLSNISVQNLEAETRVRPYGKIIFAQKNHWGIYLTGSQKIEYETFHSLWERNPYLAQSNQVNLRESDYTFSGTLEILPFPGLRIKLAATQERLSNAGYFHRDEYVYDYLTLPVTRTSLKSTFRWQINPALSADWITTISHFDFDSTVAETGSTNHWPYQENLGSELTLNYKRAPFGTFGASARIIGQRYPTLEKMNKIDPIFLMNFSYEKKYNEFVTLFAQIHNVLNQNYFIWEGYREPGIYFLAGVEGKW